MDTIASSSAGNASVHWRGLQQFLKWAELDGELERNPMRNLSGPQPAPPVVPVIELDKLQLMLATVSGGSFVERRDNAILRLLIDTGIRRGELVGLRVEDVRLLDREATVTGKASKQRIVRFGAKTAKALDRYLRLRSRHPHADCPGLWLSTRSDGAVTYDGIAMIVRRRSDQAGIDGVYLHRFRHTFAHLWLDQGGAEGDLMELAGWTSRQMLTRYGASARSLARDGPMTESPSATSSSDVWLRRSGDAGPPRISPQAKKNTLCERAPRGARARADEAHRPDPPRARTCPGTQLALAPFGWRDPPDDPIGQAIC